MSEEKKKRYKVRPLIDHTYQVVDTESDDKDYPDVMFQGSLFGVRGMDTTHGGRILVSLMFFSCFLHEKGL